MFAVSVAWAYHLRHLIPFVIAAALLAVGVVAWLRWESEVRR